MLQTYFMGMCDVSGEWVRGGEGVNAIFFMLNVFGVVGRGGDILAQKLSSWLVKR